MQERYSPSFQSLELTEESEVAKFETLGYVALSFAILLFIFMIFITPVLMWCCRPVQPTMPLYGTHHRRRKTIFDHKKAGSPVAAKWDDAPPEVQADG